MNLGIYSLQAFENIRDGERFRLFETNVMSAGNGASLRVDGGGVRAIA